MSTKDMNPPEKVILRESDGQHKIVNKRDVDLTNYQYIGMKQFGKSMLEEYHAK